MTGLPSGYDMRDAGDAKAAHAYLNRSYWAGGIDFETVKRSLANSFCVSIWHDNHQVAFARVVTDFATMAYLADVYVLEEHRGKGLSKAMLVHLHAHPSLQGLRRWALFTQDAQGLYEQFGWQQYPHPERMMVRDDPDIYR
jgi:GNAT superfamily N-acetyltransferase